MDIGPDRTTLRALTSTCSPTAGRQRHRANAGGPTRMHNSNHARPTATPQRLARCWPSPLYTVPNPPWPIGCRMTSSLAPPLSSLMSCWISLMGSGTWGRCWLLLMSLEFCAGTGTPSGSGGEVRTSGDTHGSASVLHSFTSYSMFPYAIPCLTLQISTPHSAVLPHVLQY